MHVQNTEQSLLCPEDLDCYPVTDPRSEHGTVMAVSCASRPSSKPDPCSEHGTATAVSKAQRGWCNQLGHVRNIEQSLLCPIQPDVKQCCEYVSY